MLTPSAFTFECRACGRRFEAAGQLEEWTSALYGPCRQYRAPCPSCAQPAREYRPKARASEETDSEPAMDSSVGGEEPAGEGAYGDPGGGFDMD